MNPQDHDGRVSSPWIESAESADVVDLPDRASFDDVGTGSIPVRQQRVRATPELPAPVSAAALRMETGFPVRHRRGNGHPVVRRVLITAGLIVTSYAALLMGMLAGLEFIGGTR